MKCGEKENTGKKNKIKNSQGRDPITLQENSQGRDPRTFEETARERTQAPLWQKPSGGKMASSEKVEERENGQKRKNRRRRSAGIGNGGRSAKSISKVGT